VASGRGAEFGILIRNAEALERAANAGSDAASWVTGQTLSVDGGQTLS
jgi:NAD(P)-dependent dehydrogenase (short-subunit alcohol dehydrogenase family)